MREYFSQVDTRVAEIQQDGGSGYMLQLQKQLSFLLSNVYLGNGDTGANNFKIFVTRMLTPALEVIMEKAMEHVDSSLPASKLKYLQFNLHDTNVANMLKFLGYWKDYGPDKHVRFASSLRFELVKQVNRCFTD